MSNPLDPIWDTWLTLSDTSKVVKRTVAVLATPAPSLANTRFHHMNPARVLSLLDEAQADADDQTVLSLYARFEAALRDHFATQSLTYTGDAGRSAEFGRALQAWFQESWDDVRMDQLVRLFSPVVGTTLVSKVGTIRVYRHWLAHGRRWEPPPRVTVQFVYQTLSEFLEGCGLT